MNLVKDLEKAVNQATDELLQQPNFDLLLQACEVMKKRADLQLLSFLIYFIGKGLKKEQKQLKRDYNQKMRRCYFQPINSKSLELLEMATFVCDMPFHTQIATKDFIMDLPSDVIQFQILTNKFKLFDKFLYLLELWKNEFSQQKDLLPLYFQFYDNIKVKKPDLVMPPYFPSKYKNLQTRVTTSNVSTSILKQIQEKNIDQQSTTESTVSSKYQKTKEDLDNIKENLKLLNQLIDEHNLKEDVKNNDILIDLINSMTTTESKLQSLISEANIKDENFLQFCLNLNDDINQTIKRYEKLKQGIRPKKFKSTFKEKAQELKQQDFSFKQQIYEQQQPMEQSYFPSSISQAKLSQNVSIQQKQNIQQKTSEKEVDLLGNDENIQQIQPNQSQQLQQPPIQQIQKQQQFPQIGFFEQNINQNSQPQQLNFFQQQQQQIQNQQQVQPQQQVQSQIHQQKYQAFDLISQPQYYSQVPYQQPVMQQQPQPFQNQFPNQQIGQSQNFQPMNLSLQYIIQIKYQNMIDYKPISPKKPIQQQEKEAFADLDIGINEISSTVQDKNRAQQLPKQQIQNSQIKNSDLDDLFG